MATLDIPRVRKPRKKIAQRQAELRARLWPDIHDGYIWNRHDHDGFTSIPRALPLILSIVDDLTNGKPASMAYFELWGRAFDEGFVNLTNPKEIAFNAGYTGQRGERVWRERMQALADVELIKIEAGPSGKMSYALILNPYLVIRRLYDQGHPGVLRDKYNALMQRAAETSATDFELPDPWKNPPDKGGTESAGDASDQIEDAAISSTSKSNV
jgi:hypothetical protein